MNLLAFLMPRNPKKDALVSAYRRRPPEPETLNINLNVGGALTIKAEPPQEPSKAGVFVTAEFDGFSVKGKGNMVYKLPDDHTINVQVSYVDAKGHPATLDGDVTWTTSDEMIANVGVLQGDSTKAQIAPGANLGQAQITASADADLGEGTRAVVCTMDVEVVGGEAVSGTITPEGEPQPIQGEKPRPEPRRR